jgi:hypothetical protein
MQQIEQRMFDLFNALNSNDEFDVACAHKTLTGSRLPPWQCEAAFMRDAEAREIAHAIGADGIREGLRNLNRPRRHHVVTTATLRQTSRENSSIASREWFLPGCCFRLRTSCQSSGCSGGQKCRIGCSTTPLCCHRWYRADVVARDQTGSALPGPLSRWLPTPVRRCS